MAMINIVVSIYLVKRIGITGVIAGTIVSRVTTQNWYDPYLVYKHVFQSSVWRYYIKYLTYGGITLATCWICSSILAVLPIQNDFVKLIAGAGLSVFIPNAAIILLFYKTQEFRSVLDLIKKVLRRKL